MSQAQYSLLSRGFGYENMRVNDKFLDHVGTPDLNAEMSSNRHLDPLYLLACYFEGRSNVIQRHTMNSSQRCTILKATHGALLKFC